MYDLYNLNKIRGTWVEEKKETKTLAIESFSYKLLISKGYKELPHINMFKRHVNDVNYTEDIVNDSWNVLELKHRFFSIPFDSFNYIINRYLRYVDELNMANCLYTSHEILKEELNPVDLEIYLKGESLYREFLKNLGFIQYESGKDWYYRLPKSRGMLP